MWQTALRAPLLRYLLRVSPVASKNELIFLSPAMTPSMMKPNICAQHFRKSLSEFVPVEHGVL